MVSKINPNNPDKIADRIAGAIVDKCYSLQQNPNVNVYVSLMKNLYNVTVYSSVPVEEEDVREIIHRITGEDGKLNFFCTHIDDVKEIECDECGVFEAYPMTGEEMEISDLSRKIFEMIPFNGKCSLDESLGKLVVDQSRMRTEPLSKWLEYKYPHMKTTVNPLGEWGGEYRCGFSNNRLDSDFGHSLINRCIHGKDCMKADVSLSIYAWLLAQSSGKPQKFQCNAGDKEVDGIPYKDIVDTVKEYISMIGGYESLAEWGLI